jgi:hypothetical protein
MVLAGDGTPPQELLLDVGWLTPFEAETAARPSKWNQLVSVHADGRVIVSTTDTMQELRWEGVIRRMELPIRR